MPKHKVKFEMVKAIDEFADVQYWYKDGYLPNILSKINFKPDFIFHYDIAYNYALSPKITGLNVVDIPKGCFVIDSHFDKNVRINYFEENKIDIIFSVTKGHFLSVFPEYQKKFKWHPWSIDPTIFKDWNMNKDINYLLMGLVNNGLVRWPPKGKYPFREAVLQQMKNEPGFIHHPHPGLYIKEEEHAFLNEKYAKELNKAKIFFTCGSKLHYPVLKFFEAPACKTLLLAEPNQDILELGFTDGSNFIACNINDFYEKAKYYLQNEEERKRITDNGYHFIHSQHTNRIRAQEFINTIKKFLNKGIH